MTFLWVNLVYNHSHCGSCHGCELRLAGSFHSIACRVPEIFTVESETVSIHCEVVLIEKDGELEDEDEELPGEKIGRLKAF